MFPATVYRSSGPAVEPGRYVPRTRKKGRSQEEQAELAAQESKGFGLVMDRVRDRGSCISDAPTGNDRTMVAWKAGQNKACAERGKRATGRRTMDPETNIELVEWCFKISSIIIQIIPSKKVINISLQEKKKNVNSQASWVDERVTMFSCKKRKRRKGTHTQQRRDSR